MLSPTGVIPENLMYRDKKGEVINFLQAQPYEGITKRRFLIGWAVTVGIKLTSKDYQRVEMTGIDR